MSRKAEAEPGHVPRIVREVVSSSGQPLDAATRAMMEPRFGHDFSRVRVHTDARAARSASAVEALAYTVGRNVVFGEEQYAPATTRGQRLIAHELMHVVQQQDAEGTFPTRISSPSDSDEHHAEAVADGETAKPHASFGIAPPLQRRIRQSLVTCPAGQNPYSADRRAVTLLTNALDVINRAEAARAADPADADVVLVGNSLRTVFHFDPAVEGTWTLGAPNVRLPVIRRRIEAVRDYIDSVVFTINCCTLGGACPATCGTCAAGEEAFTCGVEASTITLCPPFWGLSVNQRGRTYAHEVFHITFGFIEDWAQPNVHNAHCYAHFVALLNGFQPPAGFRCS